MRVLRISDSSDLKKIMQDISVDPYGIKIMLPKAKSYLLRVNSLSSISANILKQEMLSFGGDVALARGALTGKIKQTDCLIMGNLSQLNRLRNKLIKQPFGLSKLALDLKIALANYERRDPVIDLGKYKLNLAARPYIMGVVNVTPDSFSGDGLYKTKNSKLRLKEILEYAKRLVKEGADIIDVGGESTRPKSRPVSIREELKRTSSVIKLLVRNIKVPVSIDTYKAQVAEEALMNGASIVNDISGLKDARMRKLIARYKAGVVIMHMQGSPHSMQNNPYYESLICDILEYLESAINKAEDAGIDPNKIIIDPGIGFGKTLAHNLEILKRLSEFKVLGKPILVGTSRKSFIGKLLNNSPQERIFGTVASSLKAYESGASILRVHDVLALKEALIVTRAINK